jgi:hypothetical protein
VERIGRIAVELPYARLAGAEAEAGALAAVNAFMERWNARDLEGWRRTLHYPHVRIASGQVTIARQPAEYAAGLDFARFAAQTGWERSTLDGADVVQSFGDTVHVAVRFTRWRADGSEIDRYWALYVVTRREGRWGIQCRSSSAP